MQHQTDEWYAARMGKVTASRVADVMAKIKTAFFCSSCGYESAKWLGKCPSCNSWNTFVEEVIERNDKSPSAEWKNYKEGEDKKSSKAIALPMQNSIKDSSNSKARFSASFFNSPRGTDSVLTP